MKERSDSESVASFDSVLAEQSKSKSHFTRTLKALFTKSFLMKVRHPISIIEFIVALLIWVVILPCWLLARRDYTGELDPPINQTRTIPWRLFSFFAITKNSTCVVAPDCNNTRTLMLMINTTIHTAIEAYLRSLNMPENETQPEDFDWIPNGFNATNITEENISDFFNQWVYNITDGEYGTGGTNGELNLTDFVYNISNGIDTPIDSDIEDFFNRFPFPSNSILLETHDNNAYSKMIRRKILLKTFSDAQSDYYNNEFSQYLLKNTIKNYRFFETIADSSFPYNRILSSENDSATLFEDDNSFGGGENDDWIEDSTQGNRNITEYIANFRFDPIFVDTVEEIKDKIYEHTSNGIGIYWKNAEDNNTALRSPIIETYKQAFISSPDTDLYELLYRAIAIMNGFPQNALSLSATSWQRFATPPTEELFDMQILMAIISVLPIIISTMPDLQSLLEEKDSRVQTLSFLMGCSETAYFFVYFVMLFALSFFPYFFMCIFLCYVFCMKGTSFSLMLVVSILFILAHIAFLMFLTTFMKKASMGRMIVVVFLVLSVFFSYLHYFYTLDSSNDTEAVKHIFSIVPLSCYQMVLMTMYGPCRTSMKAFDWSMIKNDGKEVNFIYQIWYALLWLPIDFVIYFLLFLLFNLTNSRDFGSPLISWKELFNKNAWKRVFSSKTQNCSVYDDGEEAHELMKVENLSKTYYGHKEVKALTDVNFSIDKNEVIVVIGPNGAGKSTLINILAGAIEPTTGTLHLLGDPPTQRFKDIQNILGVCFQDNVILSRLSIKEHFDLFGAFKNIPYDELNDTMNFYADTLQLREMLKTRAGDLSGGQKRKLCISLSLLGSPPLVIMDEPTAGVDIQARQLIWKVIASLKHTTTIVTSHALEEAEAVSSRLFVVAGGKVPFAGTATEFRNQFKCGYVLRIDSSKIGSDECIELPKDEEKSELPKEQELNLQQVDLTSDISVSNEKENDVVEIQPSLCTTSDSTTKKKDSSNDEVALRVLEMAKRFTPEAKLSNDRGDTILLPVSKAIPKFINELEARKDELGVSSFSFSVEQLEDVLLKLIQSEEVNQQ